MTSLVDMNTYQFLQNICPFSAARHPLSATRPTAWWMELMDMAACPAPARLNWHIKEREGDGETKRQRENLDGCSALPCQQTCEGQNHGGSSISSQMRIATEKQTTKTYWPHVRIYTLQRKKMKSTHLLLRIWFLFQVSDVTLMAKYRDMNVLLIVHRTILRKHADDIPACSHSQHVKHGSLVSGPALVQTMMVQAPLRHNVLMCRWRWCSLKKKPHMEEAWVKHTGDQESCAEHRLISKLSYITEAV